MSKSEEIRRLFATGRSVSDIAREVGSTFDFAYSVLHRAKLVGSNAPGKSAVADANGAAHNGKPILTARALSVGGFTIAGHWQIEHDGRVSIARTLPSAPGVYAFVVNGSATYVGKAGSIANRMGDYRWRPQGERMRELLKGELGRGAIVEIFTASPEAGNWSGWPVNTAVGLESALIREYRLDWNRMGI